MRCIFLLKHTVTGNTPSDRKWGMVGAVVSAAELIQSEVMRLREAFSDWLLVMHSDKWSFIGGSLLVKFATSSMNHLRSCLMSQPLLAGYVPFVSPDDLRGVSNVWVGSYERGSKT